MSDVMPANDPLDKTRARRDRVGELTVSTDPRADCYQWASSEALSGDSVLHRAACVDGHVGLLGIVLGFTAGALVLLWPWGPGWFEAIGTWVTGLVATSALIMAVVAYRSEELARRREHRRQIDAAEDAKRAEQDRIQAEANLVRCEARDGVSRPATMPGRPIVDQVEVEVVNLSSSAIFDLTCRLDGLHFFDWEIARAQVLGAGERLKQQYVAPVPIDVHQGSPELHDHAEFTFLQNMVRWSMRYGQSAKRL